MIQRFIDRHFRFLLLEVALDIKAWWTLPAKEVELELDEIHYIGVMTRLSAIAIALEGLVAIAVLQFLRAHGQI